jgi:hypothetical protein
VRKGKDFEVPDGIIAPLTAVCGGNVHDCKAVTVTSSKPYSGQLGNAAKNVVDLESHKSCFFSVFREKEEDIPHTRNNRLCSDFEDRRIVPAHYLIRAADDAPGWWHLKSWLVETSDDGENWRELDHKEEIKRSTAPGLR